MAAGIMPGPPGNEFISKECVSMKVGGGVVLRWRTRAPGTFAEFDAEVKKAWQRSIPTRAVYGMKNRADLCARIFFDSKILIELRTCMSKLIVDVYVYCHYNLANRSYPTLINRSSVYK